MPVPKTTEAHKADTTPMTDPRPVLADPDDDPAFDPPTAPIRMAAAPPPQPSAAPPNDRDRDVRDTLAIEDLSLPKSIITRLAKGVLPPNTQIQANAMLALCKSATVFVNYIASHANESTLAANKKTVMPADVFKALEDTEFGFMRETLEAEFAKFHETNSAKRSTYRKKIAAAKKGPDSSLPPNTSITSTYPSAAAPPNHVHANRATPSTTQDPATNGATTSDSSDEDGAPRAKKPKLGTGDISMEDAGEESDAETVADEEIEEDDEEEDEEVEDEEVEDEEEDENTDEGEDDDVNGAADDETDDDEMLDEHEKERRRDRRDYDEAVDDSQDEDMD